MGAVLPGLLEGGRYLLYLEGLKVTLLVTIGAIILGTILGIFVCMMRISGNRLLSGIAQFYITVIRGTPVMLQILIFYMVIFTSPNMSKVMVAIVSFGINSGAYLAEILRAGINAVDWGQTEAGRSLGLSRAQTMAYIILPQAVKNILPAYTNEFIVLIKETAVVGYIALQDLTMMAGIIKSQTYEAFFPLLIAALIYLSLTVGLTKLFGKMERRLGAGDRR